MVIESHLRFASDITRFDSCVVRYWFDP